MTQQISNLEGGGSVRSKLNEVIEVANTVPGKVDKLPTAQAGNVAVWGEGGVLLDSGVAPGGGTSANVPNWIDVQFDILPIDYVVQYNGRLFSSKVDDNQNNVPPLEGENDYWVETSESQASGTPEWVAGTYLVAPAEVLRLNTTDNKYYQYVLRAPVPFISSDFDTELAAGSWQLIGGDGGGGGESFTTIHIDSATTPVVTAQFNHEYIIDTNAAPVRVNYPAAPTAGSGRIRVTSETNTHKITLTTALENVLIRGYNKQIIGSIGATIEVVAAVGHYDISFDTNNLSTVETLSASRDFSDGDGIENNIIYACDPSGASHVHILPTASTIAGNKAIISTFRLESAGSVVITDNGSFNEVLNVVGTSFDIVEAAGYYSIKSDTRPKTLQAAFTSYALTEDSDRTDSENSLLFKARATDPLDPRLSSTPTEIGVTVGVSSPNWVLLSSSITERGVLLGLISSGNINIYTTIRKASGVQDMNYQVRYFKVANDGTQTLIGTSNTLLVQNTTAQQFLMTAQHVEFSMAETDALAVKTYAQRTTSSGTPTFYSTIEGANPTRSELAVPTATIAHNSLPGRNIEAAHNAEDIALSTPLLGADNQDAYNVANEGDKATRPTRTTTTLSVNSNSIALDWNSLVQLVASNLLIVTANASITYANTTLASECQFRLNISNLATLTFPSGTYMQNSDARWNSTTRVFTPTGNGRYEIVITKVSTEYFLKISDYYIGS